MGVPEHDAEGPKRLPGSVRDVFGHWLPSAGEIQQRRVGVGGFGPRPKLAGEVSAPQLELHVGAPAACRFA